MSNNSLFDEAIADAKKLREVAEENAKKAVLEAVTPKIKEFIEQQVLEQKQDDGNEVSEEDSEVDPQKEEMHSDHSSDEMLEMDETAVQALIDLMNESQNKKQEKTSFEKYIDNDIKEIKDMSGEKYYEIDLQMLKEAMADAENESLSEEEEFEMPDFGEKEDMPDLDDSEEESDDDMGMGGDVQLPKDLAQQLYDELGDELGGGMPDLDDSEEDSDDMDDSEEDSDDMEIPDAMNEVFEVDPKVLRRELSRIRRKINESGLAHEKGGIAKDYEHHFGGKGHANSKGGDFGGGKPGKDVLAEMRSALRNQRRQNGNLQTKLTKYRSAVQTLREQLEELNLFNAKLLYVNKLLQNKQISESQKRSVVQALDEARDLNEAKVLYKSLTESFSQDQGRGTLNESIRLGSSSKTTRSGSSSKAATEVDRWARLAGLK